MDFVSLALFGVAVVGLGAAATVIIAKWLPQSAIDQAAQHGRFAGLGEAPLAQPVRQPVRAHIGPKVGPQVGRIG
jgi:hypothetical protein